MITNDMIRAYLKYLAYEQRQEDAYYEWRLNKFIQVRVAYLMRLYDQNKYR